MSEQVIQEEPICNEELERFMDFVEHNAERIRVKWPLDCYFVTPLSHAPAEGVLYHVFTWLREGRFPEVAEDLALAEERSK